jgi:hypothetical protein
MKKCKEDGIMQVISIIDQLGTKFELGSDIIEHAKRVFTRYFKRFIRDIKCKDLDMRLAAASLFLVVQSRRSTTINDSQNTDTVRNVLFRMSLGTEDTDKGPLSAESSPISMVNDYPLILKRCTEWGILEEISRNIEKSKKDHG